MKSNLTGMNPAGRRGFDRHSFGLFCEKHQSFPQYHAVEEIVMLRMSTWVQLACIPILILGTVMVGPTAVGAPTGHVHPNTMGASANHADHSDHTDHSDHAAKKAADHAANRAADHATSKAANGAAKADFGDTSQPRPLSTADLNSGGANGQCPGGPYCSTRDGSPSLNGNGDGQAVGRPCAGCVGRADNKNPAGQFPDGTDPNAGYECDRNSGIGRSNPAHTNCRTSVTPPEQPPGIIIPPGPGIVPPEQPPGRVPPTTLPPTGASSGSGLTGLAGLSLLALGIWLTRGVKRPASGM